MPEQFRILSLDGGGLRGAYGAALLARIEELTGKSIVSHFDLITGTSTGGLLALGLALGHSASRLLEFYRTKGPLIFARRPFRYLASYLACARYSPIPLRDALIEFFGEDTLLSSARCRVVIPSFDADSGRTVCFKTRHHEDLRVDHGRRVWEIGMATSAAPFFFPPYRSSWGTRYVDGGIWANRPLIVGLMEALKFLKVPREKIQVLAIGTAGAGFRLPRRTPESGWRWAWGGRLFSMLITATECAAGYQSRFLVSSDQIMTVDERAATPIALDDHRCLEELRGRGEEAAKNWLGQIQSRFLRERAQPFEAIPFD